MNTTTDITTQEESDVDLEAILDQHDTDQMAETSVSELDRIQLHTDILKVHTYLEELQDLERLSAHIRRYGCDRTSAVISSRVSDDLFFGIEAYALRQQHIFDGDINSSVLPVVGQPRDAITEKFLADTEVKTTAIQSEILRTAQRSLTKLTSLCHHNYRLNRCHQQILDTLSADAQKFPQLSQLTHLQPVAVADREQMTYHLNALLNDYNQDVDTARTQFTDRCATCTQLLRASENCFNWVQSYPQLLQVTKHCVDLESALCNDLRATEQLVQRSCQGKTFVSLGKELAHADYVSRRASALRNVVTMVLADLSEVAHMIEEGC